MFDEMNMIICKLNFISFSLKFSMRKRTALYEFIERKDSNPEIIRALLLITGRTNFMLKRETNHGFGGASQRWRRFSSFEIPLREPTDRPPLANIPRISYHNFNSMIKQEYFNEQKLFKL